MAAVTGGVSAIGFSLGSTEEEEMTEIRVMSLVGGLAGQREDSSNICTRPKTMKTRFKFGPKIDLRSEKQRSFICLDALNNSF